jgi:hypothetical protein
MGYKSLMAMQTMDIMILLWLIESVLQYAEVIKGNGLTDEVSIVIDVKVWVSLYELFESSKPTETLP